MPLADQMELAFVICVCLAIASAFTMVLTGFVSADPSLAAPFVRVTDSQSEKRIRTRMRSVWTGSFGLAALSTLLCAVFGTLAAVTAG